MSRSWFVLLLSFVCFASAVTAQVDTLPVVIPQPVEDTLPARDSAFIRDSIFRASMVDSFSRRPVIIDSSKWSIDPSMPMDMQVLRHNPYFSYNSNPVTITSRRKSFEGKEDLFYVMVVLLLVFAFLKTVFAKYFSDLFRLFFRTTMKQRQIRDQLMQTPLPSLLFNVFFIISAGLYADFMLLHFSLIEKTDFWLYFVYCALGLSAVYFVKYIGLKILGWIFNLRDAADSYIFIVFIVNKVIGIFLLPFLVMLAFMGGTGYSVIVLLSWIGIGVLLLYRFILTYAAVRNQVKFNPFHFLLYLLAFEVAPLLLIYKLLLVFFD